MKIEPPADDLSVQRLKVEHEKARDVGPARQVEPYAPIGRSEEKREVGPALPEMERRRGERRCKERRATGQQALLDTRQPHERRQHIRREEDREKEAGSERPKGIDTEA